MICWWVLQSWIDNCIRLNSSGVSVDIMKMLGSGRTSSFECDSQSRCIDHIVIYLFHFKSGSIAKVWWINILKNKIWTPIFNCKVCGGNLANQVQKLSRIIHCFALVTISTCILFWKLILVKSTFTSTDNFYNFMWQIELTPLLFL